MTAAAIARPFEHTLAKIEVSADMPTGASVPMNSVQINIALLIDTDKALRTGKLEGSLFMMDNGVDAAGKPSAGRGTAALSTVCMQGMVLNWFAFAIAGPILPAITQIEFIERPVCDKLAIYGAPAVDRSPRYLPGITPIWHYWAGIVLPEVPQGRYHYRMDILLGATTVSVSTPSLDVAEIPRSFKRTNSTLSSNDNG